MFVICFMMSKYHLARFLLHQSLLFLHQVISPKKMTRGTEVHCQYLEFSSQTGDIRLDGYAFRRSHGSEIISDSIFQDKSRGRRCSSMTRGAR